MSTYMRTSLVHHLWHMAHNELANQIGAQSYQWCICKWSETAWPISGQKMVEIQGSTTKGLSSWRRPPMSLLTKFELNPTVCLKICRKSYINQRPQKGGNSAENDQRLIRLGEVPIEFAHKILAQSDQQLVWKCAETVQPIRGQEVAGNTVKSLI